MTYLQWASRSCSLEYLRDDESTQVSTTGEHLHGVAVEALLVALVAVELVSSKVPLVENNLSRLGLEFGRLTMRE